MTERRAGRGAGPLRALLLVGIVVVACGFAWVTWPHPALHIEVDAGGHAVVVSRWHQRAPLGDTVRITSQAPAQVEIDNHDVVMHRLGMFAIPAGASRIFTISQAGVYSGFCSAHPGRELTYIVDP